jgi:hypothetical protein
MKFNYVWIFLISIITFILYVRKLTENDYSFFYRYNSTDSLDEATKKEISSFNRGKKGYLTKVFLVAFIMISWLGVWKPTQQFNTDQEKAANQYEAYISEYNIGWSNFCSKIISRLGSNNYSIYGKNLQMTYPSCEALKPSNAGINNFNKNIGGYLRMDSVEHIGQMGRAQGFLDANDRIFTFSPYWCWGTDCVTKYDLL